MRRKSALLAGEGHARSPWYSSGAIPPPPTPHPPSPPSLPYTVISPDKKVKACGVFVARIQRGTVSGYRGGRVVGEVGEGGGGPSTSGFYPYTLWFYQHNSRPPLLGDSSLAANTHPYPCLPMQVETRPRRCQRVYPASVGVNSGVNSLAMCKAYCVVWTDTGVVKW